MELLTKYVEKINEEKGGKELYFEEIPTANEREQLKANGYRWSAYNKCWYIKLGVEVKPKAKCEIDIAGINLKEFTELLEEEKKNYVDTVWGWGGEKWKNEQLKKHIFLKTKDGYILAVENEKYKSISKTLWYDDELPIPDKSKRLFIDENLKLHTYNIGEKDMLVLYQAYYKHEKTACVKCTSHICDYENIKTDKYYIRDLTEGEKQEYIKIHKTIINKYTERLSKYYDKYGEKTVHCEGYWVNR